MGMRVAVYDGKLAEHDDKHDSTYDKHSFCVGCLLTVYGQVTQYNKRGRQRTE